MSATMRIHHVALVVDDIDEALKFWRDGLGLEVSRVEDVPDQSALVALLTIGDQEVELVKPTVDDSGLARYLERRGPGMHHIALEVADIQACIDHLAAAGVRLINEEPVVGARGNLVAFIHPESTHGVLVELYELTHQQPETP